MATQTTSIPAEALRALEAQPFLQTLLGRRSRRFAKGASLPSGPLAYTSSAEPQPLSRAEELLVLLATGGATGWNYGIVYDDRPAIANYGGSAVGRPSISGAGFQVSDLFFTNDDGLFFLSTRDSASLAAPGASIDELLEAHRPLVRKLSDERLHIPRQAPWLEPHNNFVVNKPGTTLILPVADLAQHLLAVIWYFVQNGYGLFDDLSGQPIAGIEQYADLLDLDSPRPLSFVEKHALAQVSVELATGAYAGALTLNAIGLGGWSFDGIDVFGLLGASGRDDYPGLGFRYDSDPSWATPNPTGLEGVFEGFTPPHVVDLEAATRALVARKFGAGGPFNRDTAGPFRDNAAVRGGAVPASERAIEATALIAQHIYDVHGRFPATVPAVYARNYLQAHHLDLGFYDQHFGPGAYLDTHAKHDARWHGA
ncbi:hypothetical protein [Conexibacter sp. CPCC 206217]|uniref:hypothetical protein n=1 Tax=Conexibacter sp. CPCC 206217 TaxID=3064574 RepID=UPI0027238DDF|nr:hypothetical protein [Conexibacter sp. CPCC 206217]MDO8208825.1 hypothetical protein [Conexibacter sp. CPCC 206217]